MKLKELIHYILIAIAVSGALASCTYEEIKPQKIEVPDSVKFSVNIIPIFNTSCNKSGCHNKGGIPPDLSEENAYTSLIFFGYVDVDVPESSILYEKAVISNYSQIILPLVNRLSPCCSVAVLNCDRILMLRSPIALK